MKPKPAVHTHDEKFAKELAIANTATAIATIKPVYLDDNKPASFSLLFANPAFVYLIDASRNSRNEEIGEQAQKLLKKPNMRALLRRTLQEGSRQSANVHLQKLEQSLVLHMVAVPVDGRLIITMNDVTKLSHSHEMLELQTAMMEENARALDTVRSALEAEIKRRGRLEGKLRRLAGTDPLSGLSNRRSFLEKAGSDYRRSRRYRHSLSLVMLDLDRFKLVNDTHGHAAGDAVIVAVSQICQSLSRNGADSVGRLGGEEFAILLPETGLTGAKNIAERLRLVIENTPIYCDIKKLNITASLGVATLTEQDMDFASLLSRADAALYKAKDSGRNMVSAG